MGVVAKVISFREFLTENSVNSKNYTYNKYDSYLNEEINRDKLQDIELLIKIQKVGRKRIKY